MMGMTWRTCKRILELLPGCLFWCEGFSSQCSQQPLPATAPEVCLPRTRSMKMKRKECMANMYSKSNMASSPHSYFQPQVVWEEKLRPSTNAWPTCCLWNAISPIQFPHGLVEMQAVLCNPQIHSHVNPREQILHAPCHQRLLGHNPRLFWGLCATGILTIPLQKQNNSILFPKTMLTVKKLCFYKFLPLLFYTTVVFLFKGVGAPFFLCVIPNMCLIAKGKIDHTSKTACPCL